MSIDTIAQEFQYEPLPDKTWIRLINIYPNLQDDLICCSLQHFDNNAAHSSPAYIALSYMWGDPNPTKTVYVNGWRRDIHENLWLFLHRMWLSKADDWFWTDSLCIDQACHGELNEQVARMGDIYSRADHVISWLGESEDGAKALETMADFGADTDSKSHRGLDAYNPATTQWWLGESNDGSSAPDTTAQFRAGTGSKSHYSLDVDQSAGKQFWHGWMQLIVREDYWRRVWVFQEVACATRSFVVYGSKAVDFEKLLRQIERAVERFNSSIPPGYPGIRNLKQQWMFKLADLRDRIATNKPLQFLDLLERMSYCSTTRLVDRVYGLLGLAERLVPGFNPQSLDINYDKTLSDIAWDLVFLTIETTAPDKENGYTYILRDVFRAIGDSPCEPRNHQTFPSTPAGRKIRARTICEVNKYIGSMSNGPQTPNSSAFDLKKGLRQAVAHVWTHTKTLPHQIWSHTEVLLHQSQTDECVGALLGLTYVSWKPVRRLTDGLGKTEPREDAGPWLCAAHLPDHLQGAIWRMVRPASEPHRARLPHRELPCCQAVRADLTVGPCSTNPVFALEISDLVLVVRLEQPNEKNEHTDIIAQWYCIRCRAAILTEELARKTEVLARVIRGL